MTTGSGPSTDPPAGRPATERRRLRGMLRPRRRRVDLLIALLLGALGFAAAVQVRSTQGDGILASARQEDMVLILDDLSGRSERLRQEVTSLTGVRERLAGGASGEAALEEARRRTQLLGVLTGVVAASGPGVVLTIDDPDGGVRAEVLLDALEELRDAGAEAVQLEGRAGGVVRVVASTAFVDGGEGTGVIVDGLPLQPPYRFVVLGDPGTLSSALGIPGGVLDTVAGVGATASVEESTALRVGAVRTPEPPRYARPTR